MIKKKIKPWHSTKEKEEKYILEQSYNNFIFHTSNWVVTVTSPTYRQVTTSYTLGVDPVTMPIYTRSYTGGTSTFIVRSASGSTIINL